jgi:hypothetical protein
MVQGSCCRRCGVEGQARIAEPGLRIIGTDPAEWRWRCLSTEVVRQP